MVGIVQGLTNSTLASTNPTYTTRSYRELTLPVGTTNTVGGTGVGTAGEPNSLNSTSYTYTLLVDSFTLDLTEVGYGSVINLDTHMVGNWQYGFGFTKGTLLPNSPRGSFTVGAGVGTRRPITNHVPLVAGNSFSIDAPTVPQKLYFNFVRDAVTNENTESSRFYIATGGEFLAFTVFESIADSVTQNLPTDLILPPGGGVTLANPPPQILDEDKDTGVKVESTAGADEDTIVFTAAGNEVLTLGGTTPTTGHSLVWTGTKYEPQLVQGTPGPAGPSGGDSAYTIAVANGYIGTEAEWLASLNGTDGTQGIQGVAGPAGQDGLASPITEGKGTFVKSFFKSFYSNIGLDLNDKVSGNLQQGRNTTGNAVAWFGNGTIVLYPEIEYFYEINPVPSGTAFATTFRNKTIEFGITETGQTTFVAGTPVGVMTVDGSGQATITTPIDEFKYMYTGGTGVAKNHNVLFKIQGTSTKVSGSNVWDQTQSYVKITSIVESSGVHQLSELTDINTSAAGDYIIKSDGAGNLTLDTAPTGGGGGGSSSYQQAIAIADWIDTSGVKRILIPQATHGLGAGKLFDVICSKGNLTDANGTEIVGVQVNILQSGDVVLTTRTNAFDGMVQIAA